MTEYVLLVLFRFEFDSFDFHSGLKEIHWRLHDSLDSNMEHGSGHVTIQRHNDTVGIGLWFAYSKQPLLLYWVLAPNAI